MLHAFKGNTIMLTNQNSKKNDKHNIFNVTSTTNMKVDSSKKIVKKVGRDYNF